MNLTLLTQDYSKQAIEINKKDNYDCKIHYALN